MIGQAKGQGQIYYVPGREEYSSMSLPEHFAVKNEGICSETVPIASVDDLVEEHGLSPALLKVDVEGAEFSVFNGSRQTLSRFRPVVLSELWCGPTRADGHTGAEILRMFEALDYVVVDPADPMAKPGREKIGEIMCIPRERYDPLWMRPDLRWRESKAKSGDARRAAGTRNADIGSPCDAYLAP
jgi:hypothetical protein